MTRERTLEYHAERLSKVLATTLRKELAALNGLRSWAYGEEDLPKLPGVPKRAVGTPYKVRRRKQATELSPAEIARLLAALPEWSSSKKVAKFPIRSRFVVAYATSLRPATLDALSIPEHWQKGSRYLTFPPDLDKTRDGRPIPLTPAARAALQRLRRRSG